MIDSAVCVLISATKQFIHGQKSMGARLIHTVCLKDPHKTLSFHIRLKAMQEMAKFEK